VPGGHYPVAKTTAQQLNEDWQQYFIDQARQLMQNCVVNRTLLTANSNH